MKDYMCYLLLFCVHFVSYSVKASKPFSMKGDGGNIIVGKYRYGRGDWRDRLLQVTRIRKGKNSTCEMENKYVLVAKSPSSPFYFPPSQCFDSSLNEVPFKEKCNPRSPNSDATNTSFSQVHDALFLFTWSQQYLVNDMNDRTLLDCCGQIRVCVLFPEVGLSFALKTGKECNAYFGTEGDDTVDEVSPSVVGHLLGYLYTACTSRLQPKFQSGAIMESFANFAGIFLKASLKDLYETDWKYGSDIVKKDAQITALSHFDDPPLDGKSIDHVKDYNSKLDRHQSMYHNAGIYNKAIFNLASLKYWSIKKTFILFLRANRMYWKRNTTFDDGLCDLMKAANDLGFKERDVEGAFAKVGVKCGQDRPKCKNIMGKCMLKRKCERKKFVHCPKVTGCKRNKVCCFAEKKAPPKEQCKS